MTYKLTDEELEELDKMLSQVFKKGVDAIREKILEFVEEKVPYE
jgi:F0F1-type ATP synthase delta subunit